MWQPVTKTRRAERQRSRVLLHLLTLGYFLYTGAHVSAQPEAEPPEAEVDEKRTKVGARLLLELPEPA